MVIETPNINDYEEVNLIARQVHKLHVNWRPDLFLDVDVVISEDLFNKMIESKSILVSKIDNKVVGFVSFTIQEKENPIMRYRKQMNIDALGVDEHYRGNGIGTSLLTNVKTIAKANNCTDLYLTVNEENESALKLYTKFGMRVKNIAYSMEIK